MDVVAGIEVTAQDSTEVLSDQVLDHFSRSRVMVLIVAHRRRTDTPDEAILAIFSPPCLIGLHGRAGSDLLFEHCHQWFQMSFSTVQQFGDLVDDLF